MPALTDARHPELRVLRRRPAFYDRPAGYFYAGARSLRAAEMTDRFLRRTLSHHRGDHARRRAVTARGHRRAGARGVTQTGPGAS
ncbi:unnamed protein product [[Actinomadura] parvosata subsp. kistnae]|nr:unnamed protein product [Actinomadura parvosata subsp. kistnae]